MKYRLLFIWMTLLTFLIIGCTSEDSLMNNDSDIVEKHNIYTDYFEKKGYDVSDIAFNDDKKSLIIEGDILFSYSDIDQKIKSSKGNSKANVEEPVSIITQPNYNILYYIKPELITDVPTIVQEVDEIYDLWTNFTALSTQRVFSESQAHTVWDVSPGGQTGSSPTNGQAGPYILINNSGLFCTKYRKQVLAHEIGHTLGFEHIWFNHDPTLGCSQTGTGVRDTKVAELTSWQFFVASIAMQTLLQVQMREQWLRCYTHHF